MKDIERLSNNRITLLPLQETDISTYLTLVNDPKVASTTSPNEKDQTFTAKEIEDFFEKISTDQTRYDWAIHNKSDDSFVGEVIVNDIKNKVRNIRIAIKSECFDQGFGTSAMQLVIKYMFDRSILNRIELGVYQINQRGFHVYQKLGFKTVCETTLHNFPYTLMAMEPEKI